MDTSNEEFNHSVLVTEDLFSSTELNNKRIYYSKAINTVIKNLSKCTIPIRS